MQSKSKVVLKDILLGRHVKGEEKIYCAVCIHLRRKKVCTDPFNILFKLFLYAVILNWFVEKIVVQDAFDGKLIEEEQIECRPEKSQIQF